MLTSIRVCSASAESAFALEFALEFALAFALTLSDRAYPRIFAGTNEIMRIIVAKQMNL